MRAERLVLLVGLLAGCGRPGAVETSIPLMVAGTELEAPIEGRDGWSIELSRADLAFGPLYLCSGVKAGDSLNLREDASPHAKIVARFSNGTVLRNLGCKNAQGQRWCRVERADVAGQRGWVNGRHLRESAAPAR